MTGRSVTAAKGAFRVMMSTMPVRARASSGTREPLHTAAPGALLLVRYPSCVGKGSRRGGLVFVLQVATLVTQKLVL